MSLLSFCEWLAATPGSIALHESRYIFLVVLTVHVMTLCVFVGMAVMMDLRLLGLTMLRLPASDVVSRLVPWVGGGFLVMVISGLLLFYAAPVDKYENLFFRAKMAMLVLACVNAWVFHKKVYCSITEWDLDPVPPLGARLAGGVALTLWAGLILAGRMIPYQLYWFG
tara:strand:+ start:77 stop:580 length:504 start_codon:yes stop_codon:yes gene_type:complete